LLAWFGLVWFGLVWLVGWLVVAVAVELDKYMADRLQNRFGRNSIDQLENPIQKLALQRLCTDANNNNNNNNNNVQATFNCSQSSNIIIRELSCLWSCISRVFNTYIFIATVVFNGLQMVIVGSTYRRNERPTAT